jgi:hypothetical protein
MGIGKRLTFKRHAVNSGHVAAKFTISQEAHPKLGQTFDIEIFEEVSVTTDPESSMLLGNGSWPIAITPSMVSDGSFEFGGVPMEVRVAFIEFIGDGNGAAQTLGTLTLTATLPGLDPNVLELNNACMQNVANFTVTREGSAETLGGPFTNMLVNGIDPLDQRF